MPAFALRRIADCLTDLKDDAVVWSYGSELAAAAGMVVTIIEIGRTLPRQRI